MAEAIREDRMTTMTEPSQEELREMEYGDAPPQFRTESIAMPSNDDIPFPDDGDMPANFDPFSEYGTDQTMNKEDLPDFQYAQKVQFTLNENGNYVPTNMKEELGVTTRTFEIPNKNGVPPEAIFLKDGDLQSNLGNVGIWNKWTAAAIPGTNGRALSLSKEGSESYVALIVPKDGLSQSPTINTADAIILKEKDYDPSVTLRLPHTQIQFQETEPGKWEITPDDPIGKIVNISLSNSNTEPQVYTLSEQELREYLDKGWQIRPAEKNKNLTELVKYRTNNGGQNESVEVRGIREVKNGKDTIYLMGKKDSLLNVKNRPRKKVHQFPGTRTPVNVERDIEKILAEKEEKVVKEQEEKKAKAVSEKQSAPEEQAASNETEVTNEKAGIPEEIATLVEMAYEAACKKTAYYDNKGESLSALKKAYEELIEHLEEHPEDAASIEALNKLVDSRLEAGMYKEGTPIGDLLSKVNDFIEKKTYIQEREQKAQSPKKEQAQNTAQANDAGPHETPQQETPQNTLGHGGYGGYGGQGKSGKPETANMGEAVGELLIAGAGGLFNATKGVVVGAANRINKTKANTHEPQQKDIASPAAELTKMRADNAVRANNLANSSMNSILNSMDHIRTNSLVKTLQDMVEENPLKLNQAKETMGKLLENDPKINQHCQNIFDHLDTLNSSMEENIKLNLNAGGDMEDRVKQYSEFQEKIALDPLTDLIPSEEGKPTLRESLAKFAANLRNLFNKLLTKVSNQADEEQDSAAAMA